MRIPVTKGKEVKIAMNGANILPNNKIILSSEITLTLTSTFKELLGESAGTAVDILQMISQTIRDTTGANFGVRFKEQGYKIWSGAQPIRFSFETQFDFKTSGKKDVLTPAKELMKLCLPTEGTIGLVAPGPSVLTALNADIGKAEYKRQYSFRCGAFYLPSVVIETVEPTWSSEVDSQGYPMWCALKIDVSSIFTATTNQIDKFDYNIAEEKSGTLY